MYGWVLLMFWNRAKKWVGLIHERRQREDIMVQMDFHLDYEIPDETLSSFSKSLSINHTITELQIEK